MQRFSYGLRVIYRTNIFVLNLHLLNHVADMIYKFGPSFTQSAFPFESKNRICVTALKSSNGEFPINMVRNVILSSKLKREEIAPTLKEGKLLSKVC